MTYTVQYIDHHGRRRSDHRFFGDTETVVIEAGPDHLFLKDLVVKKNGLTIFEYGPRFAIVPGAIWCRTFKPILKVDGNAPTWADNQLSKISFLRAGPFSIPWEYDVSGASEGGYGVERPRRPHGAAWWRFTEIGCQKMFQEMDASAMRARHFWGVPINDPGYELTSGHYAPAGLETDLDKCRRWDPSFWDHHRYGRHDWQHGMREWRWWDEWAEDSEFASWCLDSVLDHYEALWGKGFVDKTNQCLWGAVQILSEGKQREHTGREFAHTAGLLMRRRPASATARLCAQMLISAGIPWHLSTELSYCSWAREKNGGPMGDDEAITMSREATLVENALPDRLLWLAEQELAWHGTNPRVCINGDISKEAGGFNPDYPLFYGDLKAAGYESVERLDQVASTRHPDGGAQPYNCWNGEVL